MENEDGETFEVEIDECDPEEHRTFDNCLKLSKAIKNFIAKGGVTLWMQDLKHRALKTRS